MQTAFLILIGASLVLGPINLRPDETLQSGCDKAIKEMNIEYGYAGEGSSSAIGPWYYPHSDKPDEPVPFGTPIISIGGKIYKNASITCVPAPAGMGMPKGEGVSPIK